MQEVWKSVVGYEGIYSVSNLGRVRREGSGFVKGSYNPDKYIQIGLCRFSKRKLKMLHRIVVESFLGPIKEGYEVNHIDGDKDNNALSNLEAVTPKENNLHARLNGLWRPKFGEDISHAKLNDCQVLQIRKLYLGGGETCRGLAKKFGVNKSTIHKLLNNRSWKHLK